MATTTKTNNENIDPQTSQAELAYRIVSTLIGQRSSTRLSPADVRQKRDGASVVLTLIDTAGYENPLAKDTPVTMYIERGGSAPDWPAEISIVASKVDATGKVTLPPNDFDKVIASLIVKLPSGNVDLGRIESPPADDGANRQAAPKSPAKKAAVKPPAKKAAAKPRTTVASKRRSQSTTTKNGG